MKYTFVIKNGSWMCKCGSGNSEYAEKCSVCHRVREDLSHVQ